MECSQDWLPHGMARNTPAFGVPGSNLGSGGFGIAGVGASDREMQFSLKLYY